MAAPRMRRLAEHAWFRTTPVTVTIIICWVVMFFVGIVVPRAVAWLAFTPRLPNLVTGLITYPLAVTPGDILSVAFGGLALYWFGGSLERIWGSRTYLLFLLAANAAAALLWEGALLLLLRGFAPLAGVWLLVSTVVVAWAWINPEETILLWFILPLKAKWVGWLTIAGLFFFQPTSVTSDPLRILMLGPFTLGGVAVALAYDWYRRRWGWIPRRPRAKPTRALRHPASHPLNALLRPFREWQRRRRVAHLQRTFKLDD